ncbi:MAG TPA: acyl-CoA dehydrogenase family protein, partial [Alphaproteobacteria bacterium]|nr:acyl-CoA dehydrogenase family protein [Alphaproteobacteria bacterium]
MNAPLPQIAPETESQILDALDKFLDRDVRPHVMRLEHADEYPHDIVEGMKDLGLFGAIIPEEYGGLGLPATTY